MAQINQNVLHVISGDLWAGAEVMAYNLLSELKKQPNLNIFTVVLNSGKLSEKINELGIPHAVIPEGKNSFFKIVSKVNKFVKENKIHVIHSHRYKENILTALVSIVNPKIKAVSTLHGLPEFLGSKKNIRHKIISILDLLMYKLFFDHVVAVSSEIKNLLTKFLPAKKIQVVHNGIVINTIEKNGSLPSQIKIGTAARLFPVKNISLLVDIAEKIQDFNVIVKIAGNGPEYSMLLEKVKRLKLENVVQFVGEVDDMESFYKDLSVYINTSIHEGIPISILEAMALKLPIIAPNVGGIPEIINHNVEGLLAKPQDRDDFVLCCKYFIDNPSKIHSFGAAAFERVSTEFSVKSCCEKYQNIYKS